MMKLASACPNSDMGVVWGLLCLHPNTIKPSYSYYYYSSSSFYHFCVFHFSSILAVSMATAAILKKTTLKDTTSHGI
jgi:hypothetical protein